MLENEDRRLESYAKRRRYQCEHESCRKEFMYPYQLRNHASVHTGIKRFSCPFKECSLRFKWRSSLSCHTRTSHAVELTTLPSNLRKDISRPGDRVWTKWQDGFAQPRGVLLPETESWRQEMNRNQCALSPSNTEGRKGEPLPAAETEIISTKAELELLLAILQGVGEDDSHRIN